MHMNNGYRERMAKTCAPLVRSGRSLDHRPAYAQPPQVPQLAVDQLPGARAARRPASGQEPIRPGAYGRSGPRYGVATSCGLGLRWFNRAAVGAASFIDLRPQ
jgi:hypothetical protein